MSLVENEAAAEILGDHFGLHVASVGRFLLAQPAQPLPTIFKRIEPRMSVKEVIIQLSVEVMRWAWRVILVRLGIFS